MHEKLKLDLRQVELGAEPPQAIRAKTCQQALNNWTHPSNMEEHSEVLTATKTEGRMFGIHFCQVGEYIVPSEAELATARKFTDST